MTTEVESVVGPYTEGDIVLDQEFDTKPWWWTKVVETSVFDDLPTPPEKGPWKRISRRALFGIAADPTRSPLDVLVACYAWGMGASVGNLRRYRLAFRDNVPTAINERLGRARDLLASQGPVGAYRSLSTGGADKVVHLGPSFFTKFLYAADGLRGDGARVDALILDQFVVAALNQLRSNHGVDTGLEGDVGTKIAWSPSVYDRWLDFAHAEALRASVDGRIVRPDAVEIALFRHGRTITLGR